MRSGKRPVFAAVPSGHVGCMVDGPARTVSRPVGVLSLLYRQLHDAKGDRGAILARRGNVAFFGSDVVNNSNASLDFLGITV